MARMIVEQGPLGIMRAQRLATDEEKAQAWDTLMSSTQNTHDALAHAAQILVDRVAYRVRRVPYGPQLPTSPELAHPEYQPLCSADRYCGPWINRSGITCLSETDDDSELSDVASEFADGTDPYTHDLLKWAGSHSDRWSHYCDEYVSEFGDTVPSGLSALLTGGQYMERNEVFGLVVSALESELSKREDN